MTCSQCGYIEAGQLQSADYYMGVRETVSYLLGVVGCSSREELGELLTELYENADGLCRDWYRENMLIKTFQPRKRTAKPVAETQSDEGEA